MQTAEYFKNYNKTHKATRSAQAKRYYTANKLKLSQKSDEYYEFNRIQINKKRKDYRDSKRLEVITHLGGKCNKCGFNDIKALQIDHINGGGRKDRNGLILGFFKKVLADDSDNYQLLCANCNTIKRIVNHEHSTGRNSKLTTHCPKGHEYNKGNTYIYDDGRRRCKICAKLYAREKRGKL
jgi:hypothetical protein